MDGAESGDEGDVCSPGGEQPRGNLRVTSSLEDPELLLHRRPTANGTPHPRGEAKPSRSVPRRHTLGGARGSLEVLAMQPPDMEKKREAFLEHLKHKYPHHASVIMGHQERLREQSLQNMLCSLHSELDIQRYLVKIQLPHTSQSPKPGGAPQPCGEEAEPVSVASVESLDTMSESDTPQAFSRGSRVRASLPVVRSTNQTKDRSLGVLYLQYGDETKQIRMPNQVTSVDTVRALFVGAFPQQLSMKMLESPSVAVYVKDDMRNLYYELTDVRNITAHSCLKVYHKDPAQAFNQTSRPTNGDPRMPREMMFSGREGQPPLRHPPMPGSMSPPTPASVPSSPSRIPFGPRQGSLPTNATVPRERLTNTGPGARAGSPCPSAILERRDVKPDEDLGARSHSLSRGSEGLYADPYLLQDGRMALAAHPGPGYEGPEHGPGGYHRASIRSTGSYGPADTVDHPSLYRQRSRNSQLPTLGSKTPPPSPHRMTEVRMIDIHGGPPQVGPPHGHPHGPLERCSPVRQSFRKEEAAGAKPRGNVSSPVVSELQGPLQGGPHLVSNDPQTRQRMKAMEQQIASLTGLVQHALLKGPNSGSTKEALSERPSKSSSPAHSVSSAASGGSPVLGPRNGSEPSEKGWQPLQVNLKNFRRNISDLRLQLQQMRQMQLQNQEVLRTQLKLTEQEIGLKLAEAMRRADEPAHRQRTLVEEDRLKYLGLEQTVLSQLGDLELYVDSLQKDSLGPSPGPRRLVTLRDVEEGAVALRKVGEALAGLKGEFPGLQNSMRSVLRVEVEAVKFLKEEPHKLDSMLKRVKSLTESLSGLRRCATEVPASGSQKTVPGGPAPLAGGPAVPAGGPTAPAGGPAAPAGGPAAPAGGPAAPAGGPAAPAGGPAALVRGPAAPAGGPAAPPGGPAAPVRGPAAPAGGPAAPAGGPTPPAGGPAAPAGGPAAPAGGPAAPVRGPAPSTGGPAAPVRGPAPSTGGPAAPVRGPAAPIRGPASSTVGPAAAAVPAVGPAVPAGGPAVPTGGPAPSTGVPAAPAETPSSAALPSDQPDAPAPLPDLWDPSLRSQGKHPPPAPLVIQQVQSSPVLIKQSQTSAALVVQYDTATPSPASSQVRDPDPARRPLANAGTNGNGTSRQDMVMEELQNSRDRNKSRAMSIEAAEKEWEERRQNMGQYDGKEFERLLLEAEANMMKGLPTPTVPPAVTEDQALTPSPVESPADTGRKPEEHPLPGPEKSDRPPRAGGLERPSKSLTDRPSPSSKPASVEKLGPKLGSEKTSKSPPPPPPRKTYPISGAGVGSGLTTTRSGEVVFTSRGRSGTAQEGEEVAPPPALQATPTKLSPVDTPAKVLPIDTPTKVSTIATPKSAPPPPDPEPIGEEEDDGEKIMAELQVFQKFPVKDVALKNVVEPQIRELRPGDLVPLKEEKSSEPAKEKEDKSPTTDENGNTTVRPSPRVIYYVTGQISKELPLSLGSEESTERRESTLPPSQVSNVNPNVHFPSQLPQSQPLPNRPMSSSPISPPPISPKPVGLNGFKLPRKQVKRSVSLKTSAEVERGNIILNQINNELKSSVIQENKNKSIIPEPVAASTISATREQPAASPLETAQGERTDQPRDLSEMGNEEASLSPDLPGEEAPPPPDNIAFMITNSKVQALSCGEYQELVNSKKGRVQTVTVGGAGNRGNTTGNPAMDSSVPPDNGFNKKPVIIIFDEPMDIRSAYKRLSTIFECEEEMERMLAEERIEEESEESDSERGDSLLVLGGHGGGGSNVVVKVRDGKSSSKTPADRGSLSSCSSSSSSELTDSGGNMESVGDAKQDSKKRFKFRFPKKQLAALSHAIRAGTKSGKKTLQVVVYEDEEESDGTVRQHKEAKRFEIVQSKDNPKLPSSAPKNRDSSDSLHRTDDIRKSTYKTLDSLEETIKQLENTISEMGPCSAEEPGLLEKPQVGERKSSEGAGLKRSASLPSSRNSGPKIPPPSKSSLRKKSKPQLLPRPVVIPATATASASTPVPSSPGNNKQQNASVVSPTSRMPVPMSAKARQPPGAADKTGKQPKLQDTQRQFRQANGSAKRVGGDHKTSSPTVSKIPAFYPSATKGSSQSAPNADATNPINPSSSSSSSTSKSSLPSPHPPRSSSAPSSHLPSLSNGSPKLPPPSQHTGKPLSFSSQTQNTRAHSYTSPSFSSSSTSSSSSLSPTPLGPGGKSIRTIHTPSFTSYRSHNGASGKSCIPTVAKDTV